MPSPEQVRTYMRARELAVADVDFEYPYTPEQWERIERWIEDRTAWLVKQAAHHPAFRPRRVPVEMTWRERAEFRTEHGFTPGGRDLE
jgi:hypothetical protein